MLILVGAPPLGFGWGREGHEVVALIAEQNMTPAALARAKAILGGVSLEEVASWADEYRRDHRETGPWHYINIPLSDSKIDMTRECANGDCVIGKTEQFLAVLRDPKPDRAAKAEALKYVVHFVGDLHQPLQRERRRQRRERAARDLRRPARQSPLGLGHRPARTHQPESRRCCGGAGEPHHGTGSGRVGQGYIEDWVLEGHRLAQTVAYGDLGSENPSPITPAYERQADPVIELQLEKAGVRLAYLLNGTLK
jgi:hypothetical protein